VDRAQLHALPASHKPPIAKPVNPDFPPLSPELDNDSSVARLLELADIALTRNTDDDLS
jgi:hypothetical protein